MPGRDIALANDQIYHVFNRGVNSQKIFNCERDYFQFIDRMKYYQNIDLPIRYSHLQDLSLEIRTDITNRLWANKDFLVEIISYCLMPNHFHLILKQLADDGISKFISNLSNSYTRYYNVKSKRVGPIFQGKFKAVEVEGDEQLCHLSRYCHLNPYSAGIVNSIDELIAYPYSSLGEYLGERYGIGQSDIILSQFADRSAYREFVIDQAELQRGLQVIKRCIIES
jgi:putative transposase